MGKYYAVYQCPMCSTKLRITDKNFEMDDEKMPELLAKVVRNQQFLGTNLYEAPIYIPHKCQNGDRGLARFIGFKKVKANHGRAIKFI